MASSPSTQIGGIASGLPFSQTSTTLSSSGVKVGAVYAAPKAGNISHIAWGAWKSGTSPTYEYRLETISSNVPSGSLFSANANGTFSDTAGGTTWQKKALTSAATVAKGDLLGAVLQYSSGTIDGSNWIQVGRYANNVGGGHILPYSVAHNGSSWNSVSRFPPMIALYYDDGSIIRGGVAALVIASTAFNSGSAANEYANLFTVATACSCDGFVIGAKFANSSASLTVTLYDTDGTTALRSVTITGAHGSTGDGTITLDWDSAADLTASGTYRIGIKADNANNVTIYYGTFLGTTERNASYGPFTGSSRSGSGSWSNTSLTCYHILPRFSALTAGGGIIRTGMSGGLVG